MKYTLIQPNGQVRTFFLLTVCELYQKAYGGAIVTDKVLGSIVDRTDGELIGKVAN